jgi:hypothetical protein
VTGKRGAGIPIILLHDATGGTVTVELKNGCMYRGMLDDAQDNMNCTIKVILGAPLLFSTSCRSDCYMLCLPLFILTLCIERCENKPRRQRITY